MFRIDFSRGKKFKGADRKGPQVTTRDAHDLEDRAEFQEQLFGERK